MRRNDPESPADVLDRLDRLSKDAKNASSIEKLLGIEGSAAEVYFGRLNHLLKSDQGFSFQNRFPFLKRSGSIETNIYVR